MNLIDPVIERRYASPATELRADAEKHVIEGLAVPTNSPSVAMYGMDYELVAPGAFSQTLSRDLVSSPILFLWNHESGQPLASTRPGSLQLWEEARGLVFRAQLPVTTWAADALEAVKSGLVGTSFGFTVIRDQWQDKVRTLLEVDLVEISLVTFPAYPATLGQQVARSGFGRNQHSDLEHVRLKLRLAQLKGDDP